VQFVRFYWKQESVSAGTQAGKAKILRKVQYPKVLDIYEFCSDGLKKQLDAGRELERKEREIEDTRIKEEKAGQDVEMKDESEESKQTKKAVG